MVNTNRKTIVAGGLVVGALIVGAGAFLIREKVSEQPPFTVTISEGDFEIRDYPAILVAETLTAGTREDALNRGFRILADYIFAKSRGGGAVSISSPVLSQGKRDERIAMTAPVLADHEEGGEWRTRFVMPSRYSRDTLPPPPQGVRIREISERRVASVRFAGRATTERLHSHERALRDWLSARGAPSSGRAEYAFYNSPFVPGPFRRNEVLIALG